MDISQAVINALITCAILIPVGAVVAIRLVNKVYDDIGGLAEQVLSPVVKRGLSIAGQKSGEVRRNKALQNEISTDLINATIGKYRPILDQLGINIDEYIEKYGATEVLGMAETFLPMLSQFGINPQQILGQITGQGQPQNSNTQIP